MARRAAQFRSQARSPCAQQRASELSSERFESRQRRQRLRQGRLSAAKPPSGATVPSLDQLARINGQNPWQSETKSLGSSEIDDQLEFGRLLDRHISGFCTAQDLVNK